MKYEDRWRHLRGGSRLYTHLRATGPWYLMDGERERSGLENQAPLAFIFSRSPEKNEALNELVSNFLLEQL